MRNWAAEHGWSYEVPGLIDYMVDKKMLEDVSWHNDTMPRFQIADPDDEESGITIWVDHPVGSMREAGPEAPRFMVHAGQLMSDPDEDFETDDLEKALTTAFEFAEKHITGWRRIHFDKLVKAWMKDGDRSR